MKRIICILLALLTVAALFASCGKKDGEDKAEIKEVTFKEDDVKLFEGFSYAPTGEGTAAIVGFQSHDMKDIQIPDRIGSYQITTIAKGAFENNDKIRRVRFPRFLTTIEEGAFKGSTIYGAIMVYSDKLATIGKDAFRDCPELVQLDIPASVESYGSKCFAGCPNLVSVCFRGDNVTADNSVFEGSNTSFRIQTYEPNSAVQKFAEENGYEVGILPRSGS